MGFTDITVVWEGAVDTQRVFLDDDDEYRAMNELIANVKADAATTTDLVEIYSVYHDHDAEIDCECVQYLTSYQPDWSNENDSR